VQAVEATPLAEGYWLAQVRWRMQYAPAGRAALSDDTTATYVLHEEGEALRVVFQLDHQDLRQRVEALGLLPAKSA
jgi:hypothetical protein